MSPQTIQPREVDSVQIMTIMDNTIDIAMVDDRIAKRFPLGPEAFDGQQKLPIAEHGLSLLITFSRGEEQGTVLLDTGLSRTGILHNMDAMGLDAGDIQAIVISHGHFDHTRGLPGLADRLGARRPLIIHPDAFLERKLVKPAGVEVLLQPPKRQDFAHENIEVIEESGPSLIADDMMLVSGEVARTTAYETGWPIHYAKRGDHWEPDPLILDDQCVILHVKGKGLAVITGCGHAGIINTIRHAQALTGIERVYAVMGGFHLTGGFFEKVIPPTVAALKEIGPQYLIPGHCTGWMAMHEIARQMPDAFIANSVGTTITL